MAKKQYFHFVDRENKPTEYGEKLQKWWKGLEERKGDRAKLRRARSAQEAFFVPSFHALFHELDGLNKDIKLSRDKIALVAGLCAHIREDKTGGKVPEHMARPKDKPPLSELRLRRLLSIEEDPELFYQHMRRVVSLLGGNTNLCQFAEIAYHWNACTRKNLAFDYYNAIS